MTRQDAAKRDAAKRAADALGSIPFDAGNLAATQAYRTGYALRHMNLMPFRYRMRQGSDLTGRSDWPTQPTNTPPLKGFMLWQAVTDLLEVIAEAAI
jgi:hypothetical protein